MNTTKVKINATVNGNAAKVWEYWTKPEHITQWNAASEDWHCPKAENDLRAGGKFSSTMAAKDGSMSFDFGGIYDEVIDQRKIAYTLEDGRKVSVDFSSKGDAIEITTEFDAEQMNPIEMQRDGWQAILNNFKKYAEEN